MKVPARLLSASAIGLFALLAYEPAHSETILQVTQYSYDSRDRVVCSTVRMNPSRFSSLPTDACMLGVTGAAGADRVTKTFYDSAGQVVQTRQAVGTSLEAAEATYSYTSSGKKSAVIDANGNRASYEYDNFDRVFRWYFPSPTRPAAFDDSTQVTALTTAGAYNTADYEEYGYDSNSNRTSLRKRGGQVVAYGFDSLNRMTSKGGSTLDDISYSYDLLGRQLTAKFLSSGEGITNTYIASDELQSSTSSMGGTSRTLTSTYNAAGNRTSLATTNYSAVFDYDALGRFKNYREGGATTLVFVDYDAQGRRVAARFGPGSITSWSDYGYDGLSRLTSLNRRFTPGGGNADQNFEYNPASQVVKQTNTNDAYAWTAAVSVNRDYVANGLNQYTNAGPITAFTYDANGNLISDGTNTYSYDAENRLITATSSGVTTTLSYDPLGRLWRIVKGATDTRFLYDGGQLIREYSGAGSSLHTYVHGPDDDNPLVWYEDWNGSGRHYFQVDRQGSIVAVNDDAGNILATNRYDEYGLPQSTNAGRFQYTGQSWLSELGMYYYKARIYSPTLGRFLQMDPVGYEDQINLYAYVGNDPLNRTDPSGQRDIYIAGAWDKKGFLPGTQIVQDFVTAQRKVHPGRDIQYFAWKDAASIRNALIKPLAPGEPLNVIGHSMGGGMAKLLSSFAGKITNLITIDPVGDAGSGEKGNNIINWTNVYATPTSSNSSDHIAATGRLLMGSTDTSGADQSFNVNTNHGDFPGMMGEINGIGLINFSYSSYLQTCTAVAGKPC